MDEEARRRSRSGARAGAPAAAWAGAAHSTMRDWAAYARGAAASVLLPPGHNAAPGPQASPFVAAAGRSAGPQPPPAAASPQPSQPATRPAPFSQEQTDWIRTALGDAVGASLSAFAQHVQAEVTELRTEVATVRFETAETAARLQRSEDKVAAAADAAKRALDQAEQARGEIDALAARVERMSSAGGASSGRTVARIGCRGWDEQSHVLERRAKELLELAGVPAAELRSVAAAVGRTGLGSSCEAAFVDSEALDRAAVAVKAARKCYVAERPAWLAAARTRAELAPIRQMHRLADFLSDSLEGSGSAARVTRDAASRAVAVAGVRAAVVAADRIVWTAHGVKTFGANVRMDAEHIALAL